MVALSQPLQVSVRCDRSTGDDLCRLRSDLSLTPGQQSDSAPLQYRTLNRPRSTSTHDPRRTLREKLIKIGAKIVRHGRYVTFQMAEVAVLSDLFADILRRIDWLRPAPLPT